MMTRLICILLRLTFSRAETCEDGFLKNAHTYTRCRCPTSAVTTTDDSVHARCICLSNMREKHKENTTTNCISMLIVIQKTGTFTTVKFAKILTIYTTTVNF